MPSKFVAEATERAVIGVLMLSPSVRGQVLQKYPGRFDTFFTSPEAVELLRAVMNTAGQAFPSTVEPRVPNLLDHAVWAPQAVWDATPFDAVDHFWQSVESLRQLAKHRETRSLLWTQAKALKTLVLDEIDAFVAKTSSEINKLVINAGGAHDPHMKSVVERYLQAKKDGKLGVRVPTLIGRLDEKLKGGLRKDPGELVVISGREKQRKTTLIANIISGWHRMGQPGATIWICNEQSMGSADLFGALWALEATRLTHERKIQYAKPGAFGRVVTWCLSKDDVLEKDWTGPVGQAVADAWGLVTSWNIRFYCAGLNDGNAMNCESVCAQARTDIEYGDGERVVIDNLQGWRTAGEDDYAVMNRTVPYVDAFTGEYQKLTIVASQLSREGNLKGGGGLEGRAQLILRTEYDEKNSPDVIRIERAWGRNVPYFVFDDMQIEPESGLIVDGQTYAPARKTLKDV